MPVFILVFVQSANMYYNAWMPVGGERENRNKIFFAALCSPL
jgi:hypothetical protein